jgi:hypothetical protein
MRASRVAVTTLAELRHADEVFTGDGAAYFGVMRLDGFTI